MSKRISLSRYLVEQQHDQGKDHAEAAQRRHAGAVRQHVRLMRAHAARRSSRSALASRGVTSG